MKNFRKLTSVPYGTVLKYPKNPARLFPKLSMKQKNKYKQKNRIFSLELGRALPKRLIWQVAVPLTTNTTFQEKSLESYSWSVFRAAFFGKMWLLNNASVVPGIVWPTKTQKNLIAKMKAFKALRLSLGDLKTGFLVKNLQKAYALSFPTANHSSIWKMASLLNCLESSFFKKLGFFLTLPQAKTVLQSKTLNSHGIRNLDLNQFIYPGDFRVISLAQFPEKSKFFAQVFSVGPQPSKKPIYATEPFLWLSHSFYNSLTPILKKKTKSV